MTSTLLEAPTIWELVRRRAELSAGRDMLIDPADRRVTFDELVGLAESAAITSERIVTATAWLDC